MIISASRRTDIPAFYAAWFMRRVRAGVCSVPNPRNPRQITTVSLKPEDVSAVVFWTRDPTPLLPFLPELDSLGYRYYFQYTLMDNPPALDPGMAPVERRLDVFRRVAGMIGPERVLWRYDPIALCSLTTVEFHVDVFDRLSAALQGYTRRCVISALDLYPKVERRLRCLEQAGVVFPAVDERMLGALVGRLAAMARERGMEITSCAERFDWRNRGVRPGSCVDGELIQRLFGVRVSRVKDPAQRPECRCVVSRDIGAYDTCPAGCAYCYATNSAEAVARNRARHDPSAPALATV